MISINRMRFGYGRNLLFSRLDLNLEKGGVYGLLGLNGAGKTSLLKIIFGLLFPKDGRVEILGHNPVHRSPELLSRLFLLPEEINVPSVSQREYLESRSVFFPKFSKEKLKCYLEEFEVPQGKNMNSLSQGERKKFILSFGLACNAEILAMDEPTNGLDIPSKIIFRRLISEAISNEKIFIVSTHHVRDVDDLLDPIIILHQGKIVFHQNREQINQSLSKENDNGIFDLEELFNAVVSKSGSLEDEK